MFLRSLAVYSLLFVLLAAVAYRPEWKKYYIPAKGMNSLAFLLIFFVAGYHSDDVRQFWLMLPAFFCCFVGDILMAAYNCRRRRMYFLMGLGIFLAGHLCFVRWLCRIQRLTVIDLVFPAVSVLLAWWLTSRNNIHTGRLKPFILFYTFFVALFFAKGIHLAAVQFSLQHVMIAAGSALFFASDISLLFLYFSRKNGYAVHLFNLASYYYGMFLLAANLFFF